MIGGYASTSRPHMTVRGEKAKEKDQKFVQVQRLANPLVNEVVIGTVDKDRWNATEPEDEGAVPRLLPEARGSRGAPAGFGVSTRAARRSETRRASQRRRGADLR